ncbi:hypothetical protein RintRC_5344 [Richelia intracellularis]|nr:hypothetical protein RintRC_5344 [Richelia intracellularis]
MPLYLHLYHSFLGATVLNMFMMRRGQMLAIAFPGVLPMRYVLSLME